MEEGKIKKKNSLSIPVFNGGGIAGVLVLGGTLATAALIAFFASRGKKTPTKKKSQSKDSDEESEDLNQCCESNEISEVDSDQISQMEMISTQISELEALSEPKISGVKETLATASEDDEPFLPEIMNTEIISLCKDINIDTEGLKLLVNKIHDAEEEPQILEAIEELKKEDAVSKVIIVQLIQENVINDEATVEEETFSEKVLEEEVEENQLMMSEEVEEEDSDDDNDDDDEEFDEGESEKSSVETGDSSMESNAEPIWPAETIEKLPLAIKDMNLDYNSGEKLDKEDRMVEKDSNINEDESIKESMAITHKKETDELLTVDYQPVRSGDMRMLILSILGTVLLLLMLGFVTEHKAMFSYLINGDSV